MASMIYTMADNYAAHAGKVRGYRIKLAYPNMDGQSFGSPCPTFRGRYFVAQTGDYPTQAAAWAAFPAWLKSQSRFLRFDPRKVMDAKAYALSMTRR